MATRSLAVKAWRAGAALLLTVLLSQTGCVGLDSFATNGARPPKGAVCKVVATWVPQVVSTSDPTRNGLPTPCIAGRVYLFDMDLSHTLMGDGSLIVELYDSSIIDPHTNQPKQLERWTFDADTLNQKLLKRDFFEWGYTLGLPWGSYRPDITKVEMRVRYQPKVGAPLFSDPARVTLAGQGDQPVIAQTANVKH